MKILLLGSLVLGMVSCGSAVVSEPIDTIDEPTIEIPIIEPVDEPTPEPIVEIPVDEPTPEPIVEPTPEPEVKPAPIVTISSLYSFDLSAVTHMAQDAWVGNSEMIDFVISGNRESWNKIKGHKLKNDTEKDIIKGAYDFWFPSYTMIELVFNENLQAYYRVSSVQDACYDFWYPSFTLIEVCRNN